MAAAEGGGLGCRRAERARGGESVCLIGRADVWHRGYMTNQSAGGEGDLIKIGPASFYFISSCWGLIWMPVCSPYQQTPTIFQEAQPCSVSRLLFFISVAPRVTESTHPFLVSPTKRLVVGSGSRGKRENRGLRGSRCPTVSAVVLAHDHLACQSR